MSFVATQIDADPRKHVRHYANLRGRLSRDGQNVAVWTVDLSGGGARIALDTAAAAIYDGEVGWHLEIPGVPEALPVLQRWRRRTTVGLAFDITADDKDRIAAKLQSLFPVKH